MKRLFNLVAICLLGASLVACAVTPTPTATTASMRLVQADGAYKAMVATVKEAVLKGQLQGENAVRVKAALASVRVGLDAWTLAPTDPNAEQKVLLALQAARSLLNSFGPVPTRPPQPPTVPQPSPIRYRSALAFAGA